MGCSGRGIASLKYVKTNLGFVCLVTEVEDSEWILRGH
jgi:hypothetical protein